MKKKLVFCLLFFIFALCTPSLSAWVIASSIGNTIEKVEDPIYKNPIENSPTAPYICYNASTNTKYKTIDTALNEANNGNNIVVIPGSDSCTTIDIGYSITIPNGVSLTLPYSITDNGDGTYSSPVYNASNSEIEAASWSSFADSSAANVTKNRKLLINLVNGADIKIENGGNLYLGGQFKTKGIAGLYTEINLDTDSSITVNGTFYCYGYVKENSSSYKNANQSNFLNYYNNEFDAGRLILVEETGHLITALLVQDLGSGSELVNIIQDETVCPFNILEFPNLQTFTEVKYGGKLDSIARMQISTYFVNESASIVDTTSGEALFELSSGSLCFEYCPTSNHATTNINAITRIYVNGSLQQGAVKIDAQIKTIDTSKYFLPISYKFNIFITENNQYSTNYKIKFLPGSKLNILDKATVNLNSSCIFYDETSLNNVTGSKYPTTKGKSTFINDGTFIIGSNGAIGGIIETTKTDNSATIDFTNATSDNLTVSSPEWSSPMVNVVVVSSGYFDDDSASNGKSIYQFVAGSSVTSSPSGNQCWYGEKYAVCNLNITITETAYEYDVLQYQVFISDYADGSDATEITSGITSDPGTHAIAKDKYVKISASKHSGATFTVVPDGYNYVYDTNTWYRMSGNLTLNIEPSEGVMISLRTDGQSGSGGTKWTITETPPGGNQQVTEVGTNGKADYLMVKGTTFKISGEWGTSSIVGYTQTRTIVSGPDNLSGTTFSESTTYTASGHYEIKYGITGGSDITECLLPTTLITLADGSRKQVQYISKNDELLVFNHETGMLDKAKVIFNDSESFKMMKVINLSFSNGSEIGVIYEHGFFDLTTNKYEYIREDNVNSYIGHEFYLENGSKAILTRVSINEQYTNCYSPVTEYHLNYFTEGVLSMPGGVTGIFNIFEYDDNLQYDQELMKQDIETYGLLTYEDFAELIPYEVYRMFPAQYFGVAIGKGILTWDMLESYIDRYLPLMS